MSKPTEVKAWALKRQDTGAFYKTDGVPALCETRWLARELQKAHDLSPLQVVRVVIREVKK